MQASQPPKKLNKDQIAVRRRRAGKISASHGNDPKPKLVQKAYRRRGY